MIDTSALLAALVRGHVHHVVARPHLRVDTVVPAIALAEAFAQLRRTFDQPAAVAAALLRPWSSQPDRVAATTPDVVAEVFDRATELDLGGNIHDALIAGTCAARNLPLATLDRRQHAIALALGARSVLLLPVR